MLQSEVMREKTFNMRMSPDEWARLESLAAHHEMAAAAVVRMLIKREAEAVSALKASTFTLQQVHVDVLGELGDEPGEVADIAIGMNASGYTATWKGLGRVLNELRREGFIAKKAGGYVLTAKGKAVP